VILPSGVTKWRFVSQQIVKKFNRRDILGLQAGAPVKNTGKTGLQA